MITKPAKNENMQDAGKEVPWLAILKDCYSNRIFGPVHDPVEPWIGCSIQKGTNPSNNYIRKYTDTKN